MRTMLLMAAVLFGLCVSQASATDCSLRGLSARRGFSSLHDDLSQRELRLLRQLERERDIQRELAFQRRLLREDALLRRELRLRDRRAFFFDRPRLFLSF